MQLCFAISLKNISSFVEFMKEMIQFWGLELTRNIHNIELCRVKEMIQFWRLEDIHDMKPFFLMVLQKGVLYLMAYLLTKNIHT